MQLELLGRVFPLPRLYEEERDRACRVDCKARDPAVDPGITPLATVGVASVGPQGADPLDDGSESAQNFSYVIRDERIEVGAVGREAKGLANRGEQALDVL